MQESKSRMKKCYYNKSGLNEAEKYIKGLMSRAERKNGWQMSEILGESTPYRMQQFIGRGRWSADELRDILQKYVKEKFQDESAVLVVDETGFLKQWTDDKEWCSKAGIPEEY
ncbi:MAG: transposase [Ruminococcus sp.]|nr:transposase [Ruminococcus sp.]